jgi:hypothetical protein
MPVTSEEARNNDPSIREMDLAAISEKEVFVRKANLVSVILM